MSGLGNESNREAESKLAGTIIGLLGIVSIIAHGPPLFQIHKPAAIFFTVLLPSSFGIVLVGVGYQTARGELVTPEDVWRLVGWVIGGIVGLSLVGVWIVVLDWLLGQSVPFGFLLTVNAATLGGLAGAVVGLYDAQRLENNRTLKERERELKEQNQRLNEFASVVSHDLRNPLTVAQGRLDIARQEIDSENLQTVATALDRMGSLIEDMLSLARAGKSVGDTDPVSLPELTERCWQNVDTESATLETETQVTIYADETRLQQLIENLLRNAIDHGGATVTITIGDLAGGFYIEDDGPGIPDEHREKVLEPGYSTTETGTGFGLSIVRDIVQAHDWDIRVANGTDGGARFEITGVETERYDRGRRNQSH